MEANNIEIARSYSRKVNIGNYESVDVFASAKREVPLGDADKTSRELYEFCLKQVGKEIEEWQAAREARKTGEYQEVNNWERNEDTRREAIDSNIHRFDDLRPSQER